jgi:hypothetical protein
MVSWPGLPVPFSLPFFFSTPAAFRSIHDVAGVRSSKVKVRSGRTVIRAGMGVPWDGVSYGWEVFSC